MTDLVVTGGSGERAERAEQREQGTQKEEREALSLSLEDGTRIINRKKEGTFTI